MNKPQFFIFMVAVVLAIIYGIKTYAQKSTPTITLPTTWHSYSSEAQDITKSSYGFYFTYPTNWTINYKKNEEVNIKQDNLTRVEFDFAPPDWNVPSQSVGFMGYSVMAIDIHPYYDIIENYITSEYEPFYQGKIEGVKDIKIGNKTSYKVEATSDSNEIFKSSWYPRWVVLGNKYSYEIGYGNGGSAGRDGWMLIQNTIWPLLHFD